jgi:hypothetical protein
MRKIGVLTIICGVCGFILSSFISLLWLCFNSFPSKLPNWSNLCFVGSFLIMMIGLSIWLYSEKASIISEIKKLY